MINKLKEKFKIVEYTEFEKTLDRFITKSKLTIPLFFILLFIVFEITFTFGNFLANFLDIFFNYIFSLT
jgi:Fe2+ transport system protein B